MASIFRVLGLYALWQLLRIPELQALVNTCEECSRTPSSCRRISGLYTVAILTEGTYNPVVVIPSPACSINITEFSSSSNYIAVKTEAGQGIINSYWTMVQPGQFYGAGARFIYDKESASCRGSCIYSEGPTTEPIVVQILYYDKNPGISYEFTLPNNVIFTPFDGTFAKQHSASETGETSSLLSPVKYHHHHHKQHRRHRHHRLSHESVNASNIPEFDGEYYTGNQYSRSEGRPDTTSALQAHIGIKHTAPTSKTQPGSHDYTGSRYGTHTLGGKGMSYTYASENPPAQEREYIDSATGRHIVKRYRSDNPHALRKMISPHYVPPVDYRSVPSYAAQARYQSFSAAASLNEDHSKHVVDNAYLKSLNSQTTLNQGQTIGNSQYSWKISGLTECSQTCGGGTQRTNIVCVSVSGRTQVVVTPENCVTGIKPRAQTIECNNSPCDPAWESEEWTECSVTCGSGTQTRTVECRQKLSSTLTLKVSADQCRQTDKPAIAQQCEKGLCTQWKIGQWNECSKECGGGDRRRNVRCLDKFGSPIPASYCTGKAPTEVESCNTQTCDVQWWTSDWSKDCSESCGQGVQSRTALCMSSRGEVATQNMCNKRDQPNTQEVCRSDAGCRGSWFAGAWDKCSATCGEGKRTRPVICLGRTSGSLSIVGDEECDLFLKPESQETCINSHCSAAWYSSPWSECSVTCGEGYRTRHIRCIDDNQRQSQRCHSSSKPESREACSLQKCLTRNQHLKNSRNDHDNKHNGATKTETLLISNKGSSSQDAVIADFSVKDAKDKSHKEEVHLPTTSNSGHKTFAGKPCQDTYWNCLMVTQARLCSYDYYRELCCQSCHRV